MENLVSDFHRAVRENNEKVVQQLLEEGVDPNEPDWNNHGRPAIIEATYQGYVNIVKALLESGADPDHRNAQGETALHFAVHPQSFSKDLLELLLDHSIDVNAQEKFNGFSALHVAAKVCVSNNSKKLRTEMLDIIRELCKKVNVNLRSKCGETALHRLVSGHLDWIEPVEVLIESGIDFDIQNERGETSLMCAIDKGHVKMAEVLIKNGSCVNIKDRHFQTPLHHSAQKDLLRLVILLLDVQCEVNAADLNGDRALHIAASKGLSDMVQVLVSHPGVDVNAQNIRGLTPLHTAVESGFTKVVELLLEANCDIKCESKCLLTPLDVAEEDFIRQWHPEICSMLRDALELRDEDFETSL